MSPAGTSPSSDPEGILGLDEAERSLLAQMLDDTLAPLGLDGSRLLDAMARGEPLAGVLGLPPRIEGVLYARAHSWFAAGRHDRAEQLFQALCTLNNRSADYWVGYGVCLRLLDKLPEASLALATAAALRPDWAVPHFHAAELAVSQDNWAGAADHLAAFHARDAAGLPPPMRTEAARLAKALDWRLSKNRTG